MFIKHFETFRTDPISFLKDNLNLIIVIPAAVGGLWQLKELTDISISFVRFFSVTQLIADGLLVLILFICFYALTDFIPGEVKKILDKTANPKKKKESEESVYYLTKLDYFFYALFWAFYGMYLYFLFSRKSYDGYSFYNFIIYSWSAIIILQRNLRITSVIINEKYKYLLHYGTLLLYLTYFLIVVKIFANLHTSFILPSNLKNIKNVENTVKKQNKESTVKLLYVNDKYLFFEITDKKKSKNLENKQQIEIVKFDELFPQK